MEAPSGLYLECPTCGRTAHRVIRGRLSRGKEVVLDGVVRCLQCGATRHETYREGVAREVPLIVSKGPDSESTSIALLPQEIVRVGERLDTDEGIVVVTGIEVEDRRVEEAPADQVDTLWSKRMNSVPVKCSLNKGRTTLTYTLEVPPEEEFEVGTLLDLGRERGLIHRIKTVTGVVKAGAARAEEIRRVYCKVVRHTRSGPRRRRRAG